MVTVLGFLGNNDSVIIRLPIIIYCIVLEDRHKAVISHIVKRKRVAG